MENSRSSAFSETRLLPELRRVLSGESLAVFLHFPLEERPLLSAPAGASKRETPTSNLTESTEKKFKFNDRYSYCKRQTFEGASDKASTS